MRVALTIKSPVESLRCEKFKHDFQNHCIHAILVKLAKIYESSMWKTLVNSLE